MVTSIFPPSSALLSIFSSEERESHRLTLDLWFARDNRLQLGSFYLTVMFLSAVNMKDKKEKCCYGCNLINSELVLSLPALGLSSWLHQDFSSPWSWFRRKVNEK